MARVMIRCPITGEPVDTGIGMDFESFKAIEMGGNQVLCSDCGQVHTWDKVDAFPDA